MKPTTKRSDVDSTIADIHKIRERISDAFGGDIGAISESARRRQELSNRRAVSYAEQPNSVVIPIDAGEASAATTSTGTLVPAGL